MRKMVGRLLICGMIATLFWGSALIFDHAFLTGEHTPQLTQTDSAESVIQAVCHDLAAVSDLNLAKEYLQRSIPKAVELTKRMLDVSGFPSDPSGSFLETIGKYILQRMNYTLFFGQIL